MTTARYAPPAPQRARGIVTGEPEPLVLHQMKSLNARTMAFLCGPGGGKTRALREFFETDYAVLALDPAGELARLAEDDPRVQIVYVTRDWKDRPGLPAWIVAQLRKRAKVCVAIPPSLYTETVDVVESIVGACVEENEGRAVRLADVVLLMEECQRYIPQSGKTSAACLAAVEMGRNWRWGRIMASQRPAEVEKRALGRADTVFLGRVQHPRDVDAYDEALEMNIEDRAQRRATLRAMLNLEPGNFLLREGAHPPGVNA